MLKMLSILLLILGLSLCNAQLTNILGLTDMISNVLNLSNSQLVMISDFNSESKVSHEFVFHMCLLIYNGDLLKCKAKPKVKRIAKIATYLN